MASVFVRGSLSDGSYWNSQLSVFAATGYRAVSYSRRYNPPLLAQYSPKP